MCRTLYPAPGGLGLGTTDQAEPFQDSVRVTSTELLLVYSPAAMHIAALAQEMPCKVLNVAPDGFGLGTTDQADPFQDSARVLVAELLLMQ